MSDAAGRHSRRSMLLSMMMRFPPRFILAAVMAYLGSPPALAQSLMIAPPTPVADAAPGGSAGLFVGVNEFADPSGRVSNLRFAVNDAVELAHLFVLELRLIPPERCTLALSGEPDGERATAHLAALKAAGVTVTEARKGPIFDGLGAACAAARGPDDLLVIACSSHGFTGGANDAEPFLMPRDGRFAFLADTAVKLTTVEAAARRSNAGHRLLLIDACQNRVSGKKGIGGAAAAMSPAFAAALAKPTGQTKLASCDVGQVSLELPTLRQGLFTAAFLHALRGGAKDEDGDGFIRLAEVQPAMLARVKSELVLYNRGLPKADQVEQSPTFHGPEAARRLPLAVPPTETAILIGELATRVGARDYTAALHARVAAALDAGTMPADLRSEAERFAAGGARFFPEVADGALPAVPEAEASTMTPAESAAAVSDGPLAVRKMIPPPRTWEVHTDEVANLAVATTPEGVRIVSGGDDGTIAVIDPETGLSVWSIEAHPTAVRDLAIVPGTATVVSCGRYGPEVHVWDLATGEKMRTITPAGGAALHGVAVTPDGRSVMTLGTYSLDAWELGTGKRTASIPLRAPELAFTPDGKFAVTAKRLLPPKYQVHDIAKGDLLRTLDALPAGLNTSYSAGPLAVAPDGARIVGCGAYGARPYEFIAVLWDWKKGKRLREFEGHTAWIADVAFTPDGRHLVTASKDKTVRIWDVETGLSVAKLTDPTNWLTSVAVTPDGRRVLAGCVNRKIYVWDAFEPGG